MTLTDASRSRYTGHSLEATITRAPEEVREAAREAEVAVRVVIHFSLGPCTLRVMLCPEGLQRQHQAVEAGQLPQLRGRSMDIPLSLKP